jgi:hypothetical protein
MSHSVPPYQTSPYLQLSSSETVSFFHHLRLSSDHNCLLSLAIKRLQPDCPEIIALLCLYKEFVPTLEVVDLLSKGIGKIFKAGFSIIFTKAK